MSWIVAIVIVVIGVVVFISMTASSYQTAYSDDILNELRQQNTTLRR